MAEEARVTALVGEVMVNAMTAEARTTALVGEAMVNAMTAEARVTALVGEVMVKGPFGITGRGYGPAVQMMGG